MRPLAIVLALAWSVAAHAQNADTKATIEYVRGLQLPGGGFVPATFPPNVRPLPTLRATSAAVRALKYLGAEVPKHEACANYVASCFDPESGGFRDKLNEKADLFTTAVGLMAVTELKMRTDKIGPAALKYLTDTAESIEDIRIAAAGLERLGLKSPKTKDWLETVLKTQNADGTFGKGPGQARATGGTAVIVMRLGNKLDNEANVLKTIKAGQRANGGYGKDDNAETSDLETTYRVMRCFHMLKAKPERVDAMHAFVAKCRNADGGYGMAPGERSSVGATYFAVIIEHWLK